MPIDKQLAEVEIPVTDDDVSTLILVLGKRLIDGQLTEEGKARVSAVVQYLRETHPYGVVIGFSGGQQPGESTCEATALCSEFCRQCAREGLVWHTGHVLLDLQSTNTIENVKNMTDKLISSGLLNEGAKLEVKLVSTEYHLERLISIQKHMDKQGLLRGMIEKGKELGIDLEVPSSIEAHICAEYPIVDSSLGEIYQQVDRLTSYRVYLEGIRSKKLHRGQRSKPLETARTAIARIRGILDTIPPDIEGRSVQVIRDAISFLERVVEATGPDATESQLLGELSIYHAILTALNRYVDPDRKAG